jgi:hypothetical protein
MPADGTAVPRHVMLPVYLLIDSVVKRRKHMVGI